MWTPGSFVHQLRTEARLHLLCLGVRREFGPGQTLIREGGQDTHVEVIEQGYVKVTTLSAEGRETLLAVRTSGDVVGELAAISGQQRSATVTACGRVTSRVVASHTFQAFLERHPTAARQLTSTIGDRLLWADRRRVDFVAYPVRTRVARVLVDLAATCGQARGNGVFIAVGLTQPELASMVGAAETSVHKALHRLRADGLIITGYSEITIVDPAALSAYGHDE